MTTESPQAAPIASTPAEITRLRAEVERLTQTVNECVAQLDSSTSAMIECVKALEQTKERAEQAEAQLAKVNSILANADPRLWAWLTSRVASSNGEEAEFWLHRIAELQAALTPEATNNG